MPVERLRAALNPAGAPEFEAVAREGRGVSETLRAACKAVLARLGTDLAAVERPGVAGGAGIGAGAPSGAPAAAGGSSAAPAPGARAGRPPERIATSPRALARDPAKA